MQPTHAQARPRGAIEGHRRPREGRQREDQRRPLEEADEAGIHVLQRAGVEGRAHEHDVAGRGTRDGDADQLAPPLASLGGLGLGIDRVDLGRLLAAFLQVAVRSRN